MSLLGECDKTRFLFGKLDGFCNLGSDRQSSCMRATSIYIKDITFYHQNRSRIFHDYHFVTYNKKIYREHAHVKHHQ